MPWRITKDDLSDNNNVAMSRLSNLTNKLMWNYDKMIENEKGMRELLTDGIAELAL